MMESNLQNDDSEDSDQDGGEIMSLNTYTHPDMLQPMVNTDGSLQSFFENEIIPNSCAINTPNDISATKNNVSDFKLVHYTQAEANWIEKPDSLQTTGTNLSETFPSSDYLLASIRKLQSSGYSWQSIQKSKSPRIRGSLRGVSIAALVDTGAEINVLDEDFVKATSIGIIPSNEKAQAANKLPLTIKGQTDEEVYIKCPTMEGHKMINLGFMLIVQNLGVACLIGQPGIEANNIICLLKKKIIILAGSGSVQHTPFLSHDDGYNLARAHKACTIAPGESFELPLPFHMANCSHVAITPRKSSVAWLKPSVVEPQGGNIYLKNNSNHVVIVNKADLIILVTFELPKLT